MTKTLFGDLLAQYPGLAEELAAQDADELTVAYMSGLYDGRKQVQQAPNDIPSIGCVNHDCDKCKAQQQEPAALFDWLPEGTTHIGRIRVITEAGGSLAMTTHAFKYDSAVLKVYVTDNDNEYPGWEDAKNCFYHLDFPVFPLYTSPQPQRQPLTEAESHAAFEAFVRSELGDVAVMDEGRYISPKIQNYWRTWQAAHGITGETK